MDIISEVKTLKKYFSFRFLKSLRFWIILVLMISGIVPGFFMRMITLKNYERKAVEIKTDTIQKQADSIAKRLEDIYQSESMESVIDDLKYQADLFDGRILVINPEYKVVEDTMNQDQGKNVQSDSIKESLSGKNSNSYHPENGYIEVTAPLTDNTGEIFGAIILRESSTGIIETKDIIRKKVNFFQMIVVIIVIIIAFLLGNYMVRPFDRITEKIKELSYGVLDERLEENSYLESELICEAFNKLMGKLKIVNDSRQEFVSNVSHELKTPLTSMKVLADSLLSQEEVPVELYKEFMGDLSEEIERENKIINDLLALVKTDKTSGGLNVRTEDINEILEKIIKRLEPIAAVQKVEMVFESFRPVKAEVDALKLSSAISNLVENAIKYNKENGWVHVSLNADHKFFYVEVADSGVGIPKESQEHIFERFYRVDKSHSRQIGGTGLGLSIARNVVVMHRGAVKVFSKLGEGTTFTVKIPINYIV